VSGPTSARSETVRQLQRAARAFSAGGDGLGLLPPELRSRVFEWRERLHSTGQTLDAEQWMLGLTTLACLQSQGPLR
jgi:hypothetical protein